MENSNVDAAKRELEWVQVKVQHDHLEITSGENIHLAPQEAIEDNFRADYQTLTAMLNNNFSIKKYMKVPYIEEKNIISGFISIIFGLIAGFILLLQSDYINNLKVIGFTDVTILFLIGVGIGNLNEGIGKLWDRKTAA